MTVKAHYDAARSAIVPDEPERLTRYKSTLKDGQALALSVEPWSERRHRGQQGLLHALLTRYAKAMGESMAVVKMRTKIDLGNFLFATSILDGTHSPNYRGRFVDLHDIYPELHAPMTIAFVRSEADYTVKMEAEFITRVVEMCDANGVRTDDIREEYEP